MQRNPDAFLVYMLMVVISGGSILKPISMKYSINQINKWADIDGSWDSQFLEWKRNLNQIFME